MKVTIKIEISIKTLIISHYYTYMPTYPYQNLSLLSNTGRVSDVKSWVNLHEIHCRLRRTIVRYPPVTLSTSKTCTDVSTNLYHQI